MKFAVSKQTIYPDCMLQRAPVKKGIEL